MNTTRLGRLHTVANKEKPRFSNAAQEYIAVLVKNDQGFVVPLLFTQSELSRAYNRAESNAEDCPRQSLVSKILD